MNIFSNLLCRKLGAATLAGLLVLADSSFAATTQSSGPERPNVVVIIADDLALGDIGKFNSGRTKTPNIDRLIAESVYFENGYSASAVCAPARAALHTGRYPHRTGVVSLTMTTEPELTRLKLDEVTIADVFKRKGYATGLIGKWHIGMGDDWHPRARGFDEFAGFITGRKSYFDYTLEVNGNEVESGGKYLTENFTDHAVDFIRRHRDGNFFLEVAHYAPHRPLDAPPEAVRVHLDRGLDEKIATVYAMVEILDQEIGRLLQALDDTGQRENTVVVFVSDNGPDPIPGPRFNCDLRGTKYTAYEGGLRVPFLVNWPGTLEPRVDDTVVHFIDLLPTLANLCGFEPESTLPLDGVNLTGLLRRRTPVPDRALFWQWNRNVPRYEYNAAMREGPWKLMRPYVTSAVPKPADAPKAAVLYHLANDPAEQRDVSREHPERFERMKSALEAWTQEMEADRRRSVAAKKR